MARDFEFELLGDHHDRAAFSCGVEPLDRYFRQQAGQDLRKYLAAVFVLRDTVANRVAGYYTLCMTSIHLDALPEAMTKRLPKYPVLPATLIGRLALDAGYRGSGLGKMLLLDALHRCLHNEIASLAVVVDAKDAAAQAFYEHFGFRRLQDMGRRLYIAMADVKRLFADLGMA
jgi:ribosomal protein S18 acetylase RimI-like enzyme